MIKRNKISVVEQLTKAPVYRKIKVYGNKNAITCCFQPPQCTHLFGRPDENDRGCYGDRCPSTEICKRVGNEGLRWEYV